MFNERYINARIDLLLSMQKFKDLQKKIINGEYVSNNKYKMAKLDYEKKKSNFDILDITKRIMR